MNFTIELPTGPITATIPVTLACSSSFSVNQINTGDPGQLFPADFREGETVAMIIEISKTQSVNIDATLDASTASFTIGADVCDQVRTTWSTWQVIKTHDDGPEPARNPTIKIN
jgi:hypothetical protein